MICLRCGKVEEFFGEPLQRLRRQIEAHFGFQILLARTEVGGYCSHCQVAARQRDRRARGQSANSACAEFASLGQAEACPAIAIAPPALTSGLASVVVVDPSGHRSTVAHPHASVPHRAPGRQPVGDARQSRLPRARVRSLREQGEYWIEDLNSRHGTFVNGEKIGAARLQDSDKIEFGSPDSYQLIFIASRTEHVTRLIEQFPASKRAAESWESSRQ